MTDTLRERLVEVIAIKRTEYRIYRTAVGGWAVQMTGDPYTVVHSNDVFEDCEAFVSEQVADAAIAAVAKWALEQEQVNQAAQAMYLREPPIDEPSHHTDQEDARAAIAALFEHRKAAKR